MSNSKILTSEEVGAETVSDKDKAPYDPRLAELIAALVDASFDCGQFDDTEVHSEPYDALYKRQVDTTKNIKNYVASKVKEARAEAFKDARAAVREPVAGTMSSTEFHRGFEAMRKLGLRALERAAESGEGENDVL